MKFSVFAGVAAFAVGAFAAPQGAEAAPAAPAVAKRVVEFPKIALDKREEPEPLAKRLDLGSLISTLTSDVTALASTATKITLDLQAVTSGDPTALATLLADLTSLDSTVTGLISTLSSVADDLVSSITSTISSGISGLLSGLGSLLSGGLGSLLGGGLGGITLPTSKRSTSTASLGLSDLAQLGTSLFGILTNIGKIIGPLSSLASSGALATRDASASQILSSTDLLSQLLNLVLTLLGKVFGGVTGTSL